MGELARTMIVCGLISGTQPLTIMGLLVVLGGHHGRRNAWCFVAGAFTVQAVVLLSSGVAVGGTVDSSSSPGRSLIGFRLVCGLTLIGLGVYLRRQPKTDPPETPKVLRRLTNLGPGASFVAGIAIADYTGAVLAAVAISTNDVTSRQQVIAWLLYCLLATGLPALAVILVTRSESARDKLERTIAWVMTNRRPIASWICLVGGVALTGDALIALAANT